MSQSAQELIGEADERGLAASALGCLDRCLPLLGDAVPAELLRPLWCSVAEGGDGWADRLAQVRAALDAAGPGDGFGDDEAVLVRTMLGAAPSAWEGAALREWAGACSLTALDLHERLGGGPLVSGEERRQVQVLEFLAGLAEGAPAGLRPVLDLSAEARRVLLAVVSRRARGA
ncbi:hypothetical protein QWM81_18120 [Streptomyces ficellus]|uniref:Uncharacterized protein n=1 Tax=Streptomyces ficellus TaxID=1977088 RepID=A0ABT7Z8V6_9ACTN|nr:hypothetical protein [Streptomyces ficellus]MDN3295934.1 hypothetical protein [Streptomyces ficellus]